MMKPVCDLLQIFFPRSVPGKSIYGTCYFLLMIVILIGNAKAQVATNYTWSSSFQTYTPGISTTSTTPSDIIPTGWDDNTYTAYKFPFNFTYNGVLYTAGVGTIGVDSDGWAAFATGAITMTGTAGGGSWVSISDHTGVYLNGTANNNGFCGFNSDIEEQVFSTFTATTASGSATLTGVSDFTNIKIGVRLTGTGITDGTVVNAVNAAAQTITMSSNATASGSVTITPRSSVYAFIRGIAPYRQYVIQWTRATRYNVVTGDDFSFQLVLNEGGGNPVYQTLQAVYGSVTTTNPVAQNAQAGLRGNSAADFNARTTTTNWSGTAAAGTNTATCSLTPSVFPVSGLTYTWSPACPSPASNATAITGNTPVCPGTTEVYSIAGVPGAIYYTWTYTGTNTTYSATTTLPTNTLTFALTATGGTLTVTPGNLCGNGTSSSLAITVTSVTTASISYPLPSYCASTVGTISPTLTGTPGGTYTASPSGLSITSAGVVTPSTSTAGTYTITYSYSSGICSLTATTTLSIVANPIVSVTATPSMVCIGGNSQLQAAAEAAGNYSVTGIAHTSLTPSGSPTVLWNTYADENVSAAIPMPFAFTYYGQSITQFYVCVNGFIQLQTSTGSSTTPQTLPNPATPNNIIALAWDDLEVDPSVNPGAYVRYFVNGTAPNRIMVIDYFNLDFFWPIDGFVTGQIRLYESDNHIEVAATTVNDAGDLSSKTLGIENNLGTVAVTPAGRNNLVWNLGASEAWSFAPQPVSYLWTPATFLSSTTISNPVATAVTSTTAYNVKVTDVATGCFVNGSVTVTVGSPLSGIYTVGIGGNYTTLTAAVNAYNGLCIGGPVVFSLIDNTYPGETFPIVINSNVYASSINTLTIKPAATKNPVISGSSATSLIQLNGADYVTFDGSNTTGGTTRNLSISNTAASSNTVIWITSASASNGATNDTIKNCNIYGASNSGTIACILTGSGTTAGNDAEFPNNNNAIVNDTLYRAQNAIYLRGNTASLDQNWLVSQNGIGSATVAGDKMGFRGMAVINSQNFNVTKNIINGVTLGSTGVNSYGIGIYLNVNTGNISENRISDVKHTGLYGAHGIYLGASTTASNVTVQNNFVFDIAAGGFNGFTSADNGHGITLDAGGGYKIYHNTVVLNTNPTISTTNHRAAAMLVSTGVTTASSVDMRNNILMNTQTVGNGNSRYALLSTAANTVYSNVNYNGYYSTISGNLLNKGSNAATYNTLALIQTNLGGNANSVIGISAPTSPTFTSATDYHIQSIAGNSIVSNLGTPISGITTDYDITTRNGLTPDIGADEWLMPNTGSWVGKTSIDWLVNTNWEANTIPTGTTDITLTGGYTFMPTIITTQAIRDLNISAPGTPPLLTLSSGILQINGAINRTGGTIDGSNGTVEMNGTAAQTIPAGLFVSNNLKNLVIGNNNATGVTLAGALDIYRSVTFSAPGLKLNTGGFLTFKSTATETAWLGNVTGKTISGNATVERYIPNHTKAWQFLAAPTTGQTVKQAWQEGSAAVNSNPVPGYGTQITSNVVNATTHPAPGFDVYTPSGGPSMKTYDTVTRKWVGITSTAIQIGNQKGYMLFVRGNRSVTAYNQAATSTVLRTTGKLYTTGVDAPPVINMSPNTFESIGNFYASAIDLTLLTRAGFVQDIFYVWDPKLTTSPSVFGYGAFQTFTRNGSTYDVTPGGGSYPSGICKTIESGQAFFVHTTNAGIGSVTFTETAKTSGSNLVTRPANNLAGKQLKSNLKAITGAEPVLIDGNLLQFDASYSNQVDTEDAIKMENSGENFGVRSNDRTLVVERRPLIQRIDTIFYDLEQLKVQQYQFEFIANDLEQPGIAAFLEDKYLHTSRVVSLHDTTRILFDVEDVPGSYAPDRFRIVFQRLIPTPVNITSVEAYRNTDKTITVKWKVENEMNMQLYTVERSADGRNFFGMITATPLSNNGASALYNRVDIDPLNVDNFYRIKALNRDGSIQYSAIVKVPAIKPRPGIIVYPNPVVNKVLQIQFNNQPAGNYSIQLINKLGQAVYNDNMQLENSNVVRSIQLDADIAAGTYQLLIISADGNKISKQVIIQ